MNFYVELTSGEKIGPYREIKREEESLCMAANAKNAQVLIDEDFGEIQFPDEFERFEVLFDRKDGKRLYKLSKDGKHGVYDSDGNMIIKMDNCGLCAFSYEGINLILTKREDHYGGVITTHAAVYTPFGKIVRVA